MRPRALQTDKFCAISYQFGGPFIYMFCLKVLGGLQTDMIPLPSYQFKGPLIFSFTKICSYLIGDLATDKYYIVLLVYITCQLQGPLLIEAI